MRLHGIGDTAGQRLVGVDRRDQAPLDALVEALFAGGTLLHQDVGMVLIKLLEHGAVAIDLAAAVMDAT